MTFLKRIFCLVDPNKALAAFGEDLRKIGVTMLGIALIGIVLVDDKVAPFQGLILLNIGAIVWIAGILLASLEDEGNDKNDKEDK
ncbi:hypothetical protein [Enterovibrio norvegicus]|uniref:hypothetical protein n=1 Tax=Enterovibrio norvegicus TaxID=188144 RepID=UPI00352FD79A